MRRRWQQLLVMWRGLFVGCACAIAGCDPAGISVGTDQTAITNGMLDDGDPAVVGLVANSRVYCSGTLVAPRVVLTAAHCLVATSVDAVVFGPNLAAGETIAVVHARVQPGFDPVTLADDVGVVLLGERATVAPLPVLAAPFDATFVGREVRLVGFGQASSIDGSPGRKREGTAMIGSFTATTTDLVAGPSLTCGGDSGGPAFLAVGGTEYVAGITSGGDADCTEHTRSTRADVYAGSIAAFIAATDDGAAGPGERCYYAAHCDSDRCVFPADAPRIGYCTSPCVDDAGCADEMACLDVPGEGMQCRYPAPSPGALGAPCESFADCDALLCGRDGDGAGWCSEVCTPDATSCPTGFACVMDGEQDALFACLPVEDQAAPGGCSAGGDHGSGTLALALLGLLMSFATRGVSQIRDLRVPPTCDTSRRDRMRLTSLSAVLLVAACGGGSTMTPDGSLGNAVRVTVTQGGQPVGALNAYFLDADGTLVATVITDADGRASAELHAGGSVTVMHASLPPTADAYLLDSWVGVQPGDDLALDLPVAQPGVNLHVSVPIASLPGVASYRVTSPCGSSSFFLAGQSAELSLAANCIGDTETTDFTVFAQNATEDIAALVAPMIEVEPDIELGGDYQPLVNVPISYAHVRSEQDMTVAVYAVSDRGQTAVANTVVHGTPGSPAGTFHWPSQLTTGTRVIESLPVTESGKEVLSWSPVTSSVTFDWMDQLGQAITSQATIDAEHQRITWSLADDGAPAQMAIASFEVNEGAGTYVAWTIVAPGATPQIALPQLPSTVISIPNPELVGVGLVLLRVPGGTPAWTQILGAGGHRAGFRGLISASPSGEISEVFPPGIPI